MITPPKGFDISTSEDEEDRVAQQVFKDLMRHLVCLSFLVRKRSMTGNPKKDAKCFFQSGFILEVEQQWFWATAGHILETIQKDGFRHPDQVAEEFRLVDSFGTGAIDQHYIPFDYEHAWKHFEHDDALGLDYGVVALGELEKRAMQKNNIVPVTVDDRQNSNGQACRELIVMGFPTDCINPHYVEIPDGISVRGKPTPSLISIQRIESPELPKPCPRLYGKLGDNWPEGEIDGMSGGPVFSLSEDCAKFRIIAVQSGWFRDRRITFACPLEVFGPRLLKAIKERSSEKK